MIFSIPTNKTFKKTIISAKGTLAFLINQTFKFQSKLKQLNFNPFDAKEEFLSFLYYLMVEMVDQIKHFNSRHVFYNLVSSVSRGGGRRERVRFGLQNVSFLNGCQK